MRLPLFRQYEASLKVNIKKVWFCKEKIAKSQELFFQGLSGVIPQIPFHRTCNFIHWCFAYHTTRRTGASGFQMAEEEEDTHVFLQISSDIHLEFRTGPFAGPSTPLGALFLAFSYGLGLILDTVGTSSSCRCTESL